MSASEKSLLFAALRAVLKERKVTYKDLAERTGTSESSIKRIFSIEECSLTRLTNLLGAVDIALMDLMEYASHRRVDVTAFTLETEAFFAESLDYFFIYRKLFHHRSVAEVTRRENLTRPQMTKFLRKLDELSIIKWLPEDRIQFLHAEYLKFRDDGPLKAAVYKAWAPKLHAAAVRNMGDGAHTLRLFSARCTPELKADFQRELEDLVDRFIRRASLELKTQPAAVQPLAVSIAMAPLRVGLDEVDFT